MSIRKSRFLWEEHGRMEQEATTSRWVDKLRHQLESTRRESQDRATEATGARAAELRAVERVTAAKQKLDVAKAHLAEAEAVLRKSLKALEVERKARLDARQEVITLWGQMLEAKELNSRLLERVTQQEEGLSILKRAHLSMYLFYPRLIS